mgnify:CR=1 FL=1
MINIKFIVSGIPLYSLGKKEISKSLGKENYKKIKNYTGFDKIHRLKKTQNTEELIEFTIRKFFKFSKINSKKIDSLLFVSHSRPSEMPIYSATLQNKFNLKNDIFCFDLPNSCSGFTNGLIHSYSLISSKIVKNVLLVCADTHSKSVDFENKNLLPVIADGCSCVFIEKDQKNLFKYDFGVDGNNNKALKIESLKNTKKLQMDGLKVFEFAIKRVPQSINKAIKKNKMKMNDIDLISFHQPNKSIHDHLIKMLQVNKNKIVSSFKFGNTSSPSIPISFSSNFGNKTIINKKALFCGFGAGFLWSTIITKFKKTKISEVFFL